jgi:hypothetical protein
MGARRLSPGFKLTQMMEGRDTTSPEAVCVIAIENAIDKAFAEMEPNEWADLLDVILAYVGHRSKKEGPPASGKDRLGEAIDRLTGRRAAVDIPLF